jgi:hypothetical protein
MASPNFTGAENKNSTSGVFEPQDQGERPDASSLHVREDVAAAGRCGNVHLPTGRTCTLPARHRGSCNFVGPQDAEDVAVH